MPLPRSPRALALLLGTTGALHFLVPSAVDSIVPRRLPGTPRAWTYASGVAELACAAALHDPRTRSAAGLGAAAVFVAVLPANISMALAWRDKPWPLRAAAWARVPMQIPLVMWALRSR